MGYNSTRYETSSFRPLFKEQITLMKAFEPWIPWEGVALIVLQYCLPVFPDKINDRGGRICQLYFVERLKEQLYVPESGHSYVKNQIVGHYWCKERGKYWLTVSIRSARGTALLPYDPYELRTIPLSPSSFRYNVYDPSQPTVTAK